MCNNYIKFQLNRFSLLTVHKGHTEVHTFDFMYTDRFFKLCIAYTLVLDHPKTLVLSYEDYS